MSRSMLLLYRPQSLHFAMMSPPFAKTLTAMVSQSVIGEACWDCEPIELPFFETLNKEQENDNFRNKNGHQQNSY